MLQVIEDIQAALSEGGVDERTIHKNPLHQFMKWLQEIEDLSVFPYPNAAMISTASKDAVPSSRVVLIKTYSNDGFVFYTNHGSRKGSDLNENPMAVLNFYWPIAEQQITITGSVKKVIDREAEDYFRSRPVPMGGGYHYMKLEGRHDSSGTTKNYQAHMGPTMGNDYHVSVTLPWGN